MGVGVDVVVGAVQQLVHMNGYDMALEEERREAQSIQEEAFQHQSMETNLPPQVRRLIGLPLGWGCVVLLWVYGRWCVCFCGSSRRGGVWPANVEGTSPGYPLSS
jgi:hypothetical protein